MSQLAVCVLGLLAGTTLTTSAASAAEISLFNSSKAPVAYVADDLTIYLWSGEPVAYLDSDPTGGFHVYGFNGKHLGWYVSGVLRDNNGHSVGARKEAFSAPVQLEPFKSFKQFKPFKWFKELPPIRPLFVNSWSEVYLDEFLMQGRS